MTANEALNNEKNNKVDAVEEIFDWIESILFSIFAVTLVFTFILRPAVVDGDSMNPTLHDKDKLIMSNWFYQPKDKDIVIVKCDGLNEAIVKRIIASGGQVVDIDYDQGKVYVDGVEQFEPYINDITKQDFISRGEAAFQYPVTVPEDSYFVMGDNRNNSLDSRTVYVGFVPKSDILGQAIFRVFPFNKFGKLN